MKPVDKLGITNKRTKKGAVDNSGKRGKSDVPKKPYKDEEFEAFLDSLEDPTVQAHWYEIAEALKIDNDTITRWLKHPRAVEARRKGFQEALKGMKVAGVNDWRMHESKIKMLGINPANKTDITSGGEKIEVIPILGGTSAIHSDNGRKEDPEPKEEN